MIEFIPTHCFECGDKLSIVTGKNGKLKLMCTNTQCVGILIKKFQSGMLTFKISGIGPAIYKDLYNVGLRNIADLLSVKKETLINSGIFKDGKSLDNILSSISSIKYLKLCDIIESLQFDGIGTTVSKEFEKYINGSEYDFTGFDYSIRNDIINKESELNNKIQNLLDELLKIGIEINFGKKENKKMEKVILVEFTGSPKNYGYSTKEEYEKEIEKYGVIHSSLNAKCNYLITDDMSSTSGKMGKAKKLGIQIFEYDDFIDKLKNNLL
jgi:NAD-dependent DNA ligase